MIDVLPPKLASSLPKIGPVSGVMWAWTESAQSLAPAVTHWKRSHDVMENDQSTKVVMYIRMGQ